MTIYSDKYIDQLLEDKNLGAGNFFQVLLNNNPDTQRDTVYLDSTVTLPGGSSTQSLSLSDIAQWSDSWSAWYEAQGIEPKDPVALYLDDDIHYMIHYIGLTKIGAIPVFINGDLDPAIVEIFMQRIHSTFMMCSQPKYESLSSCFNPAQKKTDLQPIKLVVADTINLATGTAPQYIHKHQDNDPVLLGHTSGTTGIPKGVQFNHKGFIFGVKKQLHKQVGDRIMSALPHSHASALSIMMSSLLRGSLVKIQRRKQPIEILDDIASFKPDLFASFPKVYVDLCRLNLDDYDLSSISYWLSTGDANHETHIKKLLQYGSHIYKGQTLKGSVFIDNLGSSEFGFAAFRNLHKLGSNQYNRRIGKPFDWVSAAILNDKGDELGATEIGFLGVRSESVTAGYWNNSLLSEKNRLSNYWLTGDLAYKDQDGIYFHVDRTTDSIHTDEGVLYSCQTEELVLRFFPEIFDCSIVGIQNENGLTSPAIEVELNNKVDVNQLLDDINSLLAHHNVVKINQITVSSSGKNTGVTGKKLKRVMRDSLALTT